MLKVVHQYLVHGLEVDWCHRSSGDLPFQLGSSEHGSQIHGNSSCSSSKAWTSRDGSKELWSVKKKDEGEVAEATARSDDEIVIKKACFTFPDTPSSAEELELTARGQRHAQKSGPSDH